MCFWGKLLKCDVVLHLFYPVPSAGGLQVLWNLTDVILVKLMNFIALTPFIADGSSVPRPSCVKWFQPTLEL